MADDRDVTREELDDLDVVRRFLTAHPNNEALELLLGTFGNGNGFGVYQLFDEAAAAHETEVVVSILTRHLADGPESVRSWCAQLAINYPDERNVAPLAAMLGSAGVDSKWAAIAALDAVHSDNALQALREHRQRESDSELNELIDEILNDAE